MERQLCWPVDRAVIVVGLQDGTQYTRSAVEWNLKVIAREAFVTLEQGLLLLAGGFTLAVSGQQELNIKYFSRTAFSCQPMYQIRHTAAKGLGVFATRNIPRGTRILAEKPVILVKSERDVYNAFRSLREQDRNELMQLSVSSQRRSNILGLAEGLWHASRQALSGGLVVTHGDGQTKTRLPDIYSITEYPAVLNVFRNNNFDIGNGTQAIFKDICRLNHACIPNAQGNFNANLDRFTIHALRPISEDEEITLSYLAEHGASRNARQNRLQSNYGFPCDCSACDTTTERGKLDEEARQRMQSRLHSYAQSISEQEGPDQITELEIMNQMIEMREEQGLAGRELATMCFSAAELAANIGRRDIALKLANKGLSLDEDAVGMDSPVLEESKARVRAMAIV